MDNFKLINRSWRVIACLCLLAFTAGCPKRGPSPGATGVPDPNKPYEPVPSQFGPAPAKITLVRADLKFVVIDFSSRVMPPVGTKLRVYRDGKRIGEVQITEPVRMRAATADILEGDLKAGDEVR